MKFPILLFVAFFLNKCSDNKSTYFIPEKFQYPENKIDQGKTFIYQNTLTKKLAFKSFKILDIEGQKYLITKQFDSTSTIDSAISLNGKTVEDYYFVLNGGHSVTKANIIDDTVISNGLKLGKHVTKFIYQTPTISMTTNVEDVFVKDTSCIWDGKTRDCLAIKSIAKVQFNSMTDTSFKYVLNASNIMYYAKNIGLIKYIIQFKNHDGNEEYGDWELKEIKNIDN
jgi:hypothetical protein